MAMRGADVVIQTLIRAGTETIFTLSGNHIMPLFDAAFGHAIRLIHTRHEGAAVHMADAYARLTGKVGVAMVTGGPGHANAIGALCTARAGETPLLLLSGHAPLREQGKGAFQELDQAAMAAPAAKASWVVQSVADLADDVAKAMRIARAGRPGPVHLSLPSDVLDMSIEDGRLPDDFTPDVQLLAPSAALDIVRMLREARRPLLIAPPALCTPLGKAAQARLAVLGLPIIPMESPRGVHDPALGAFRAVLQQADLVLLLGKQLDFTLSFGAAVAGDCRWIVIDPEDALLDRARQLLRPALALQADPLPAIDALVAAAGDGVRADPAWHEEVREAVARRGRPGSNDHLDSATLCASIGRFLAKQDDAIFISDGGEIGQWAQALVSAPDRLINGVAGAIGPGIPFAIGAKMAAPDRKVLAVMGDGTFGFHMAEFETAIRYGLPFVAVIGNDGRWNAEYQIQMRSYGVGRSIGCELGATTRYDKVVEALGGYGVLVERAADVEPALREAFASNRPACINAIIEGLPAPTFKT